MPLYPVKNLKTGEKKDLHLSCARYEEWRKENPDWDKDWSQGCAGFRTRAASEYSADAIASQSAYEDKNNSLPQGGRPIQRNLGSDGRPTATATNSQIRKKFGF
tara:strand:- start:538 stop:849 length:312 start_codon:yes stop_codon:yes gene_type:complete